ncbi:hypothetical protein Krac_5049 [Ktedonobacter racemifer DSM 44963]|uniref:Uncharacterized protein n=1 Tax=Ktedonobacter racemifer DSM 44963 TaxID=485913 RepID=D6TUG9_KTERA|nr:hypothetical protein Krac_5049 [Ktedonobacter racemifer DSM 44963]
MEHSHSQERKDEGSHFLLSPFCLMHHMAALRVEDGS